MVYIFWILTLSQTCDLQVFLPFCRLPFHHVHCVIWDTAVHFYFQLSIFKSDYLSPHWAVGFLHTFWIQVPWQIYYLQLFSLIFLVVFSISWWQCLQHKSFWLWGSPIYVFFLFVAYTFGVISKKSLLIQGCKDLLLCFLLRVLYVYIWEIYWLMAVLGLLCCTQAFSSCGANFPLQRILCCRVQAPGRMGFSRGVVRA